MSQSWKNQIITVDVHGNNGSISGSSAASSRYTEMRLAKDAENLLFENINENSVDFIPTYDNSGTEPICLPAKLPNYLINGAFGIAAGYSVSVLPHNPKEVIEETIKRIKDENYNVVLYPDLPTGGTIINKTEVQKAYQTGQGKAVIRATIEKDEKKNQLIITEIPYMKTLNAVKKSIIEATQEREDPLNKNRKLPPKITLIKNIKDATENNKPRVIIQCKKDTDLDLLINHLYEYTNCQVTIPIIFLGTFNSKFKIYKNINEIIDEWIEFRKVTIQRIKMNSIKKYKLRLHILQGQVKALARIDEVIKDIKASKSRQDTIEKLMEKYELSEIQAENIADLKLYRISALEIEKIKEEIDELNEKINFELEFFKDKSKLEELIIKELKDILKTYKKNERKTKLTDIGYKSEETKVNLIPDEDFLMLCTNNCYIKKLNLPKTQNRGGKGISVGKLKEDDYVINSTVLNSRDSIFIFTSVGNVYKFKVYEIPTHNTNNLGYNIRDLINNETIVSMIPVKENDIENENIFIMVATELNKIKLVSISEFKNVRTNGILFTRLEEEDSVVSVEKIDKSVHDSIIALNSFGNVIRVKVDDVPISLRPAFGSQLFDNSLINEGGCVTSVALVDESKSHYFLITQNGLGKRMDISEFEPQKRSTKGKMACKLREGDFAIKLIPVGEDDNIIIISNMSIMSVPANKIPVNKRPTFGATIKKIEDEEYIIDCITE